VEFLVEVTLTVPEGVAEERVAELRAAEADRVRGLAEAGHLLRLWRPQGPGWRNIGLWSAADEPELHRVLASLPLHPWMTVLVRPLDPHPNDPT
jgi:muconolactone D-isomerase